MRTDASEGALRTVLIAAVRGYSRFTETYGDEAAGRLAARFSELCSEVVGQFGGTVVEFRGDEALAAFGSARAAIRAAVELQRRLAAASGAGSSLPLPTGVGM